MKKWERDRKRVLELFPTATVYSDPRYGDSYVEITADRPVKNDWSSGKCLAFHNSWNDYKEYEKYKDLIWSEAWINIQKEIMKKFAE